MDHPVLQNELVHYLCSHYGLDEPAAEHLIAEVLAYHSLSVTDFIHQRHRELQRTGVANKAAYQQIAQELKQHRFPAPAMSERQIRRVIYG